MIHLIGHLPQMELAELEVAFGESVSVECEDLEHTVRWCRL